MSEAIHNSHVIFRLSHLPIYQLNCSIASKLPLLGREQAIDALKNSVKLNNPSDWQLLIELTGASQDMDEKEE